MSNRLGAYALLGLGGLGALAGLGLVALVWLVLLQVGTRLADAAGSVRASVGGMHERLVKVDGALVDVDGILQALGAEAEDDPEGVQAERRRLRGKLEPVGMKIRENLRALRDVARGIDDLLRTLDLPLLRGVGRADGERSAGIRERVPQTNEDDDEAGEDIALDPTRARVLVGEAREHVADWQTSLTALAADLLDLEEWFPRAARVVAALLSLLLLWGVMGQVCLFGSGRRILRHDPS